MSTPLQDILHQFNQHGQKIATGVCVVLVVLMSLSVADTVRFGLETSTPPKTLPLPANTREQPGARVNYKVSDLELFGPLELDDSAPAIVDAPETKLNLELQGVFIAEDEKLSTAIVAQRNKTGELYSIGDKLPGNAVLSAVYEDHVLIRRGARMERLMFSDSAFRVSNPQNSSGTPGSTAARAMDQKKSDLQRIRDRIRERSSQASPDESQLGSANLPASGNTLAKIRERIKANPAGVLSEAGVSAVSEGESKGYRIDAQANPLIKQAGLQSGDVILSVNGRPVGVATNDSALMDQVMASSRVRVEVQRGTRRFFLTVPVPK